MLLQFQIGDRVAIVEDDFWLDVVKDELCEVVQLAPDYNQAGKQAMVWVHLDNDKDPGRRMLLPTRLLRKLVKPPKFDSIEEAEAWLEANR